MRNKEISISFKAEHSESRLAATAQAAGRYGFDVISVYDDLGDPSPMYPLMIFAKHTKTARVGPACIAVPKYSNMESVVGDMSRIYSINPNIYLGLAPGAWMEQLGLKSATVQQMREAVGVSRYLLEKNDQGFSGTFYTVKPGFVVGYPTPDITQVPLLIGAWGEKMAALAGEIADEIKVGGSANPLMVDIIRRRVNVGTERAERKPEDVGIALGAVTVVDEDREKALYIARRRAVVYIDVIGEKDPTAVADFPDEIQAIKQAMAHGDVAEAVKHLPDELTRRFLFAGTPNDIIKQTEEIFAQGATRVEFGSPHGINEIKGIQLLGERVLPFFK